MQEKNSEFNHIVIETIQNNKDEEKDRKKIELSVGYRPFSYLKMDN